MQDSKHGMIDEILIRERDDELRSSLIEIQTELTRDNYDVFDEHMDRRQLGRLVSQYNPMTGARRNYQMYRSTHLFQQHIEGRLRPHDTGRYRISLACLNPQAETVRQREWKWLSTTVATTIWSLVLSSITLFVPEFFLNLPSLLPQHTASAAVLMATISIISFLLFLYSYRDVTIFRSYQAGVPLIVLENGRPDEHSCQLLIEDIHRGIQRSTGQNTIDDTLITEIRELRRLRDEGQIPDAAYKDARDRIFEHVQYSNQTT